MKLLLNTQWPEHLLAPVREEFPHVQFVQADDPETLQREIVDADAVFGYMTEEMSQADHQAAENERRDAGLHAARAQHAAAGAFGAIGDGRLGGQDEASLRDDRPSQTAAGHATSCSPGSSAP